MGSGPEKAGAWETKMGGNARRAGAHRPDGGGRRQRAVAKSKAVRSYERHWTPVHLDFVVNDIDKAVAKAKATGATVDQQIAERPYGPIALLADPFSNGFCLLEMQGRGYDEMLQPQ